MLSAGVGYDPVSYGLVKSSEKFYFGRSVTNLIYLRMHIAGANHPANVWEGPQRPQRRTFFARLASTEDTTYPHTPRK